MTTNNRNQSSFIMWKQGRKNGADLLNMIYARKYALLHETHEVVYLDDMIKNKMIAMQNDKIELEYWDIIAKELRG